jgi:hypothetical protein
VHTDPAGGLASVEALFAATVLLGAPRPICSKATAGRRNLRRNRWQALATNPASGYPDADLQLGLLRAAEVTGQRNARRRRCQFLTMKS